MKVILLSLQLFLMISFAGAQNSNTTNAIIGDEGFVHVFQQLPGENTNEVLRLQTHLSYVEALLKNKDISHLTSKQKEKRHFILQLLHQYWTNGVFPKNYEYEERVPCFIDRDGNICAVGYLIEKTVGREVAESINQEHQYDYLLDMKEEVIEQWAQEHGLTLQECAMIQPTYGPIPPRQTYNAPIKTSYGVSSGVVAGINTGVNMINLSNRFSGNAKAISYVGLVTGASQVLLGIANIKEEQDEDAIDPFTSRISYRKQNSLSYFNIGAGTTTILTSAFNLFVNNRIKDKRNTVNLYSFPDMNNKVTTGLSFTRIL